MSAPYVQRHVGGFLDGAGLTVADALFLNRVEDALLRLLPSAPAVDTVGVWTPGGANGALVYQKLTNAQIDAAAAIDKSKLAALNIVDADVAAGAAIQGSKLASNIPVTKLAAGANGQVLATLAGAVAWAAGLSQIGEVAAAGGALSISAGGGFTMTNHQHMLGIAQVRSAHTSADSPLFRLNGDTGANYDYEILAGNAAAASAGEGHGTTFISFGSVPFSTSTANLHATLVFFIPYCQRTDLRKDVIILSASTITEGAGGMTIRVVHGHARGNGAINGVSIEGNAAVLATTSRMALYGLG